MAIINFVSDFYRQKYQQRVQKISIDGGFSCPNRDGRVGIGGCSFCNNQSFSPAMGQGSLSITDQLNQQIPKVAKRYSTNLFFAYFQAFSNTYAPVERLELLYREALAHPQVVGLCIGTRADCLDEKKIALLHTLAARWEIKLEIGLESANDHTLQAINRGHRLQTFIDTVTQINKFRQQHGPNNLKIGTHLMLGLPTDRPRDWITAAQLISSLNIDHLKLHQLMIIKNTALAHQYHARPFPLLDLDQYKEAVIEVLENLSPTVGIERLLAQAPERFLLSPPFAMNLTTFRQHVLAEMKNRGSYQGKSAEIFPA